MLNSCKPGETDSEHMYHRVGTLCDDPVGLTCSFDAAKRWGKATVIEPYATFEAAALAVKEADGSGRRACSAAIASRHGHYAANNAGREKCAITATGHAAASYL